MKSLISLGVANYFFYLEFNMIHQGLYIDNTGKKGKGVFTTKHIKADEVIELSPVIVMNEKDRIHLDKTLLHDYIFEWGAQKEKCCMSLGYVPMYNHALLKAIVNILWTLMMKLFS
jgi:hypothetical protein